MIIIIIIIIIIIFIIISLLLLLRNARAFIAITNEFSFNHWIYRSLEIVVSPDMSLRTTKNSPRDITDKIHCYPTK